MTFKICHWAVTRRCRCCRRRRLFVDIDSQHSSPTSRFPFSYEFVWHNAAHEASREKFAITHTCFTNNQQIRERYRDISSYLPPEPTLRRLVDTEMLCSSYTEYNTTQGYYKRSTFKSRLESTPIGAELSRQFVYNYNRPCVAHLRIRIPPCLPVVFSDIYREIATQNSVGIIHTFLADLRVSFVRSIALESADRSTLYVLLHVEFGDSTTVDEHSEELQHTPPFYYVRPVWFYTVCVSGKGFPHPDSIT